MPLYLTCLEEKMVIILRVVFNHGITLQNVQLTEVGIEA